MQHRGRREIRAESESRIVMRAVIEISRPAAGFVTVCPR
jgi:hypothetical protein